MITNVLVVPFFVCFFNQPTIWCVCVCVVELCVYTFAYTVYMFKCVCVCIFVEEKCEGSLSQTKRERV